jgi:hypothetical protein
MSTAAHSIKRITGRNGRRVRKQPVLSNIVSLRKAKTQRNNVVAYGIIRSFSRPHKLNHTVVKVGRKWTCTCERNSLGKAICRHIRLARVEMARRNRRAQ